LAILAAVVLASSAFALTDEEVFRDLRINRINPGARSLALGGAFVSLADDATAAQANPAGLGFLRVSEYFAELRFIDNEARSSTVSRTRPGGIEIFVGTGSDPADVVSPTFLSAVTVYGRWSLGVSLQELVNVEDTTTSTFSSTTPAPETFFTVQSGSIDIDVANLNVSVGARINDRLAVGGTLTLSRLDVRSDVVNAVVDTLGTIVGEPVVTPTLDLATSIDDDDDDVLFSLGILYKRPKWHIGAVYRQGPDFTVTEEIVSAQDLNGDGESDGLDFKGVTQRLGPRFANRFHLPDVFAIGASWQPNDHLTLAGDVERVRHSNLADDFVAGVNVLTDEDWVFGVDDATDYRAGLEWVFFNLENWLPPMALRAGTFSESGNTIEAQSTPPASLAPPEIFGGEGRQQHVSLGTFFSLGRFKLDMAADFADTDNEYVVSFIYQGK